MITGKHAEIFKPSEVGFYGKYKMFPSSNIHFCRYCKVDKQKSVIYYNSNFFTNITAQQQIFIIESTRRMLSMKNIFDADKSAFDYLVKKRGFDAKQIFAIFDTIVHNKALQKQRLLALMTEPVSEMSLLNFLGKWISKKIKKVILMTKG